MIRDTATRYGVVSRVFHWGMALAVVALFALGWWMVRLDYYSPYYNSAPDLHRGAGILLLIALILRMGWRVVNIKPADATLSPFERLASRFVHAAFYPILLIVMMSGYLISSADGRDVNVFGWFSVPAVIEVRGLEDSAGLVHEWTSYILMALAVLHSAAALKHHFVDKTTSLTRMWSGRA